MSEKNKNQLPLEFQKVNKIEKKKSENNVKQFTSVDFYQSNKIRPVNFHKPISKIILFESE